MRDVEIDTGATFTGLVAELTGRTPDSMPRPAGDEWLGVLRQWLARMGCGLVSIADPGTFSWPGHWLAIVDAPDADGTPVAIVLFGSPSAVIASPDAPELVGRGVEQLGFRQALILVPFDPFSMRAPDRARTEGRVVGIYVAEAKEARMRPVEHATALAGKGLEGDRYAIGAGTFTPRSARLRGYDVTLIESEVLDALTLTDGTRLAPEVSRRNLVTTGIDLNALVGREFRVGRVRAFGQRLCEPCVHLQRLTRGGVVAGLVHKGGLRADILEGGEIRLGDTVHAAG